MNINLDIINQYQPAVIYKLIKRSNFIRSMAVVASGNALGQLIMFLSSPVLARIYNPHEFGAFTVYMSILGIINGVSTLKYEFAIPVPENDDTALNLTIAATINGIITAIISTLLILFLGERVLSHFRIYSIKSYILLIPIGIITYSFSISLYNWSVRKKEYKILSGSRIFQNTTLVVLQILFGLAGYSSIGLMIGQAIGQSAGSLGLLRSILKFISYSKYKFSYMIYKSDVRKYFSFALFSSSASVVYVLYTNAPAFFFSRYYGMETAGQFGLAFKILVLPVLLISQACSSVYIGQLSDIIHNQPERTANFFFITSRRLLIMGLIPATVLFIFAKPITQIIFGEQWATAGVIIRILSPVMLLQFVLSGIGATVMLIKKPILQLMADTIKLLLVILSFIAALHINANAVNACVIYGCALFGAMLVSFLLYAYHMNIYSLNYYKNLSVDK